MQAIRAKNLYIVPETPIDHSSTATTVWLLIEAPSYKEATATNVKGSGPGLEIARSPERNELVLLRLSIQKMADFGLVVLPGGLAQSEKPQSRARLLTDREISSLRDRSLDYLISIGWCLDLNENHTMLEGLNKWLSNMPATSNGIASIKPTVFDVARYLFCEANDRINTDCDQVKYAN
jgi:hypothetical protein